MTDNIHLERKLAARWLRWLPYAEIWRRRNSAMIDSLRQWHRDAAISCLRAGILWRTIVLNDLDDPRRSPDELRGLIAIQMDRRRRCQVPHKGIHPHTRGGSGLVPF